MNFQLLSFIAQLCCFVAIAAAQTILFLLERTECDVMPAVIAESRIFRSSVLMDIQEGRGVQVMAALDKCVAIGRAVTETLRVTAHAIGAMRKVMKEEGWRVSTTTPTGTVEYTVPKDSYVGVSHIVPNLKSEM